MYKISYVQHIVSTNMRELTRRVTRYVVQQSAGAKWQLKDGVYRNIQPFDSLADAMQWIDEERKRNEH